MPASSGCKEIAKLYLVFDGRSPSRGRDADKPALTRKISPGTGQCQVGVVVSKLILEEVLRDTILFFRSYLNIGSIPRLARGNRREKNFFTDDDCKTKIGEKIF